MNALSHTGISEIALETDPRHYLQNALSENTQRAYRNDIAHFLFAGVVIPATADIVTAYLCKFAGTLSTATLQRRLVTLSKAHTMQAYPDPTKEDIVKLTMRGIRRVHGKPQTQAAPILRDDLLIMLSHAPDTVKGVRDRALLLLGFCGAFRRSELVGIQIEDLEFTSQGIVVMLPRSKTDQTGHGRKVGIPNGRGGRICPVVAVNDWLLLLGANQGPLFRSVTKGSALSADALSDRAVADIIKFYAHKAGRDATRYSGHSLRSGLVTSAAQQGISSWKIRQQTGHKSDAMLARYIRDGEIFTDNAAALF